MEYEKIFDPVRKKWLAATPEEQIRQHWIHLLHHEAEYPLSFLSIEKKNKSEPTGEALRHSSLQP